MLTSYVAQLRTEVIGPTATGFPTRAFGATVEQFLHTQPRLEEFWTPIVSIDEAALTHNIDLLAAWTRERSLELMPHGKTTMAPALWQRQRAAGATGISLATMGQVRVARMAGVETIMLANQSTDPAALAWLAGELADAEFEFLCWAESVAGVELMEAALLAADTPRPVGVCVELGIDGGRTGARGLDAAAHVAQRIADSPVLRLAGVAGYEGVIGHDRTAATLAGVRAYVRDQVTLHRRLADLYDDGPVLVTAGGSAYPDQVADIYAEGMAQDSGRTRWVLRSGAYVTHDDGFYRELSPWGARVGAGAEGMLQPALRGYARVLANPEPHLVLADAGKRDFSFDEGLPILLGQLPRLGAGSVAVAGAVTALNDQHMFVRTDEPHVPVGSVLQVGFSHPCTVFDHWPYLPLVDADGQVHDLIRTFF